MVDERDLINRSRQKDQRAFEQLVALKREKAFRVALNVLGDEEEARDVAQLAFIRLWSALDGFDERARFDPWFLRIVVNLAIDAHRRRRAIPEEPGPLEDGEGGPPDTSRPGADAEVMRAELRKVLNRLAADLTPAQRAVFALKEIEQMSTEDVAAIMKIRASTVRNHLLQARRVLQHGLRRLYPEYFRKRSL